MSLHALRSSIAAAIALSSVAAVAACTDSSPAPAAPPAPPPVDLLARGEQIVSVGGCDHCHTPMKLDPAIGMPVPDMALRLSGHPAGAPDPEAQPGAQDQAVIGSTFTSFRAPFGVVYAANLTPHETGLGGWTADEFIASMRTGHRKGTGRLLLPPMPWQNLASLPDTDLRAVFAYLRSLPPVDNDVPEPKVSPEALAALEQSFAAAGAVH